MFSQLKANGFNLSIRNHAGAILAVDFPTIAHDLETALLAFRIPAKELIGSGGGEAPSTQRLRHRLSQAGWPKHNFNFQLMVDGVETVSNSHEIDHVYKASSGTIALEIEWNNKDPFFDRDLENFQRLHAQSAISVGVLITRGESLQTEMLDIVQNCIQQNGCTDEAEMLGVFDMKERTTRQRETVKRAMNTGMTFAEAFSRQFVADKFGAATTHWAKLEDRIHRGVGNPCPLLLIGIPSSVVV